MTEFRTNGRPLLHLASSSPRRRELLAAFGLRYSHAPVDVDESPLRGEAAGDYVRRLARAKAGAGRADGHDLVLGADTAVVLDERIFGKPRDRDDAAGMLAALSGRTHRVLTAVALATPNDCAVAVSDTRVRFRELRPDEALAYWQTGEPSDKAGAYAIQGIGAMFVESIEGSYSGVVGLPLFETAGLLEQAGIDLFGGCGTRT